MAFTLNDAAPTMTVKDIMTPDPVIIPPDATLREAAQRMAEIDCGILPVGTRDKLEGVITDRDIVVRAVANGRDINNALVGDYMTPDVCVCADDATPEEAASLMGENHVSRVLVEDAEGKTCGILTFGRMLRERSSMEEIAGVIDCAVEDKAA